MSYSVLGLCHVAAVPFACALIVLASMILFILSERFNLLAYTPLSLLLLLPFVVQWQLRLARALRERLAGSAAIAV